MKFGEKFYNVDANTGSNFPEAKGYQFVITNAKDTVSKSSGNDMTEIHVDIADGEHAGFFSGDKNLRLYLPIDESTEEKFKKSVGRYKGTVNTIVAQNPQMFPEEDVWATGEFDTPRLIGAVVYGVLGYNDKGYLDLKYLCSKESAEKAKVVPKPEITGMQVEGKTLAETQRPKFGKR